MRKFSILILVLVCSFARAQDTTAMPPIFERLTREMKEYKLDTSAVPEDRITRKIRELRALRGGFNINEAIEYKLQEEEKEGKTPPATIAMLRREFTTGKGKEWLDRATIWIYRNEFSYRELKTMVRFYGTSAGQKLATEFPFIMLKTLAAAQTIHDTLIESK